MMCMCMTSVLVSCDDDEPYVYGDFFYDMVTYTGTEGNNAVFTYQSYNDSPLITLTASNIGEQSFPKGQRLMLNYVVDEDRGNNALLVTVKGMAKVNTDTITIVKSSTVDSLAKEPVKIESVWRTGNYLNVRLQVKYTEEARVMALVSDGSLDENGVINCYQIQDLLGATSYYWLETYFSYYIEPVLGKPECEGVRYYVNDLSYPDVKYYEFLK